MSDRPIIFSAPMVRAILREIEAPGTGKTQTRRALKPMWKGDRLWVRETWAVGNIYDGMAPRDINPGGKPNWCGIRYAATDYRMGIKDRRSIHMPRWASRMTLTVTDVRIERLQDISEADAIAEGCPCRTQEDLQGMDPRGWFRDLWDSLNARRGFGWDTNPHVAVITFRPQLGNIDSTGAPT